MENEQKCNNGELDKMLKNEVTEGNNTKQCNMRDQCDFLNDSLYLRSKVPLPKIVLGGTLFKNK